VQQEIRILNSKLVAVTDFVAGSYCITVEGERYCGVKFADTVRAVRPAQLEQYGIRGDFR
jgi:hypothetical protein